MSDTDKDLAVHVAVCDERYRNIEASLKSGERRMTKIEYLIYAVMALVEAVAALVQVRVTQVPEHQE